MNPRSVPARTRTAPKTNDKHQNLPTMKKLFTLFTGLLLAACVPLLCGCDDSDRKVHRDGDLSTEVVIPTSMDVFKGMEITVEGEGFEQGDQVALRAETDLPAQTTIRSATELSFRIPDEVVDQTVYKIVLRRKDDYQVLGASRLTVKLAIRVALEETIRGFWGGSASIAGEGFAATDKLLLKRKGETGPEASIVAVDATSLRFGIPAGFPEGTYEFTLRRGDEQQVLGTAALVLDYGGTVPDREGASVKGIVHCRGIGVADVAVSDGDRIVKTDADGFYHLASDKRNGLVFVIQPSGYEVPVSKAIPQFWHTCTADAGTVETHNFKLEESDDDSYRLLVATDMHLANRNTPKDYKQFADGFAKEVTTAYNGSARKVHCLNLGDFAWDGYWYSNKWALPESKEAVADFGFHFWSVMGNHDNDPYVDTDFGAEVPYRTVMGPVYYAMNIGQVHYLMLDNTVYVNAGGTTGTVGERNYRRQFTDEQIAWVKEDLKLVDPSTPIIVGFHCPLYSNTWNSLTGKLTVLSALDGGTASISKLLDCFAGRNVVHAVSGHTHVNRNNQSPTHANVYEHNVAAVCGTWWWTQQYAKNNICTDGSPAGYKVFDIDGKSIEWHYKAVDLDADRQFTTYDMNEVKKYWATDATAQAAFAAGNDLRGRENDYNGVGENEVYINVWSWEPDRWTLTVSENGRNLPVEQVWKRDPLHTISYDIPRGAANKGELTFPSGMVTHMFGVTASSATSTLEIRATDRFGNTYTQTMTRPKAFTADPSK